jgi:hypothetical protein
MSADRAPLFRDQSTRASLAQYSSGRLVIRNRLRGSDLGAHEGLLL